MAIKVKKWLNLHSVRPDTYGSSKGTHTIFFLSRAQILSGANEILSRANEILSRVHEIKKKSYVIYKNVCVPLELP